MNNRETEARALIEKKQGMIRTILNGDKAKTSAYQSALVSLANDYNLLNCSVNSILNVGFQIVQAGLNPNKLFGQAYVVPFNLKNGGKTAQLQIGYKGWIALGYRNGWRFKAVAVYKCDEFSIEFGGFEDIIKFIPHYDDRNDDNGSWVHENLVGVIVYAKDSNNQIWTEFVSFKKLEKLRLKSQNQNSKTELNGIWNEWAEEMYKAKALKYVITRLPINETLMQLVLQEDKHFKQADKVQAITTKTTLNDLNKLNAPKDDIIELDINPITGEIKASDRLVHELCTYKVSLDKAKEFATKQTQEECEALLEDVAGLKEFAKQLQGNLC